MYNIEQNFKKYVPIILVILLTLYIRFTYDPGWRRNTEKMDLLLVEYDFTGMTTIFLNVITILIISILIFYLYLLIREENSYIFHKIFFIFFAILILFSFFSFVIIRNEEEKVAKEFESELYSIKSKISNENTTMEELEKNLNLRIQYFELLDEDEFSEAKWEIVNEIESYNIFRRYIFLLFHKMYYNNAFFRFVLLEFIMCLYFFKNMKSDDIEEKLILNSMFRKK